MKKIGILVGSLRNESYNKKVAEFMASKLPADMSATFIEIGNLPFYNEDLETDTPPAEWTNFRKTIGEMDAFLFLTPEYNRSVPAVLKNALDVGSRPYGQSLWNDKPAGVVSVSIGAIGGFGANHHLRQSMVFLNLHVMAQPEAYISNVGESFDKSGVLNERTGGFLEELTNEFANWVNRF